jgi:hypothetical protein
MTICKALVGILASLYFLSLMYTKESGWKPSATPAAVASVVFAAVPSVALSSSSVASPSVESSSVSSVVLTEVSGTNARTPDHQEGEGYLRQQWQQ